jgi:hypothetical protein
MLMVAAVSESQEGVLICFGVGQWVNNPLLWNVLRYATLTQALELGSLTVIIIC